MPTITNGQAASIRRRLSAADNAKAVRLESADRMRERTDAGEITDAEFRKQMDIIGGKRSTPKAKTRKARVKADDRPKGPSEGDKLRAKLGLPDLDSNAFINTRVCDPGARRFMKATNVFGPETRVTDWARDDGAGRNPPSEFDFDAYWTRKIESKLDARIVYRRADGSVVPADDPILERARSAHAKKPPR